MNRVAQTGRAAQPKRRSWRLLGMVLCQCLLIAAGCRGVTTDSACTTLFGEKPGGLVAAMMERSAPAVARIEADQAAEPEPAAADPVVDGSDSVGMAVVASDDSARLVVSQVQSKSEVREVRVPQMGNRTNAATIDFAEQMVLAKQKAMAGEFAEAETLYEELIEAFPDRFEPYYHLAIIADCRGRYSQAVTWYGQAAQLQPNSPDVHHDLGKCLIEQERFVEAEQAFSTAVRLAPGDPLFRESLAVALVYGNRYADALAQLTHVMSEADAYFRIAELLAEENNVEGVKECLILALESNPTHVASLDRLMQLANQEERGGGALAEAATESDVEAKETATVQLVLVPATESEPETLAENAAEPTAPLLRHEIFDRDALRDLAVEAAGEELLEAEVRYPSPDPLAAELEPRSVTDVVEEVALRDSTDLSMR